MSHAVPSHWMVGFNFAMHITKKPIVGRQVKVRSWELRKSMEDTFFWGGQDFNGNLSPLLNKGTQISLVS
jgi:hypothetical protein